MTPAIIILACLLFLCVLIIMSMNRVISHLEDLVIDAANDINLRGHLGEMTSARLLSAARSISE